jgi:hypothetical protein
MADDTISDADRRRALGWGLHCPPIEPGVDLGRDLVLSAGPDGTRDLATISGMPNLVQGLELALTTSLGDDVFNTDFGFDGVRVLAEETDRTLARERIRVAVIHVLRRDQRVRRIIDLKLVDRRLQAQEHPDADAWRTAEVTCAFEATSSDTVSLTIDGVIPRG